MVEDIKNLIGSTLFLYLSGLSSSNLVLFTASVSQIEDKD